MKKTKKRPKKRPKKKKPVLKEPPKKKKAAPPPKEPKGLKGRPPILENPIRRLITLEKTQWERLERISEREEITVPQVIRDMIDRSKKF